MDSKLKKWIKWFDHIKNEVTHLLIKKDIFWKVNEMVKSNKNLQKPTSFYDYMGDTYIAYAVMGVRRQIKNDSQSISFSRLLSEIIKNPDKVSRKRYKNLYKGSTVERFADRDFDRFAGTGKEYISKKMVEKDLKLLKRSAVKCEELADKRFAHTDKRKLKRLPTFKNLDDCIDVLDKMCVKYNSIFYAASMNTLMPTYQYDWEEIFRYPWLTQ